MVQSCEEAPQLQKTSLLWGDAKHPLSTEPSPTRWTVTAQGAHPDAHTWKNSHGNLSIAADRIGRIWSWPIQDGSIALGWPSRDLDRGRDSPRGQWQDRLLQGGMGRDRSRKEKEGTGWGVRRAKGREGEGRRGGASSSSNSPPSSSRQNILSLKIK